MSDWISVKDKLPDEKQYVLAWLPNHEMQAILRFWLCDQKRGNWIIHLWDANQFTPDLEKEEPTHWMPLPEPPKE